MNSRDRVEKHYEEHLGAEALERQRREARDRFECCGELEADGHHQLCSKRPADEPPAHVDGQEALL